MPDELPLGSPPAGRGRRLATGSAVVAVGLVLTGVGTLVMLALAAQSLPESAAADFTVWWAVATLLGTAYGAFEAYLARLLIADLAAGRGHARATGVMAGRTLLTVAGVSGVLVVLTPAMADRLFSGEIAPALLLPVFMTFAAVQALQRGAATGRHDFGAMAVQLGSDGVLRMALVATLVVAGLDSVTTLAAACCASAALSLLIAGRGRASWLSVPMLRTAVAVPVRPVVYLLVGSVGPLLVNNGSVPWLRSTHTVEPAVVVAFGGAVVLSRIPTQFVSAVFSPLLAHLSSAVEDGDQAGFRHVRRLAEAGAVALGAAYVALFALAGPWLISTWLGGDYGLDRANLAVLAAASSCMFVVVVLQAGLGALDRWRRIAVSWVAGTVAFGLTLLLPVSTLWRATAAPLAAVLTALVVMWWLGRTLWVEPDASGPGVRPGAGSRPGTR